MRVPYPERLPYSWTTVFAAVLLAVQLFQHTDPTFALCCFCYILVATAAFNLAGGLYRPAGAYIFFNAALTLIVGLIAKAVLDEPANSNLLSPTRTIEVYLLGMVGILAVAYIETRFRPPRGLVARLFPATSLRSIYIASAGLGFAFDLYLLTNPIIEPGTVLSTLRNSNVLLPFAVLVGVIYTAQSTNGRRSVTPLILVILLLTTIQGLLLFSKQGLYMPLFCWVLGAGIARYKLKPINFIVLGIMGGLLFYVGTPVIQSGKDVSEGNMVDNIPAAIELLENFKTTKAEFEMESVEGYGKTNYFNKPEGVLDRLQMISVDDLLVHETDRDGYFGYEPFVEGWENLIPHFFWRDKPVPYFGNIYARQLGVLGDEDTTTSVSFSQSADAYKEGGFTGVLVMEPFCFLIIFLVLSFVAGDLREHPAVILMVLIAAHLAPEGMIPGAIQFIDYLLVVVEFAIFCRYLAPVISSVIVPMGQKSLPEIASAID